MENRVSWRLGKILDDRYEMVSVLGIGGMAVVYKAYDHKQRRNVAVKVLRDDVAVDAESRRQFRTEYQAVGKLSHPNIRAVYDVVSSGDTEYIVMEYVDGINLKQYLKRKGALSWREVLHFTTQIARALNHAHSRGIIHMDIKPQNIMLPKDGSVKITDFGIAQLEESTQNGDGTDEAVGSVHYISPEQARGEPVDARSDIYSLGVVMYEMLTGQLPFDGQSVEEVARKHFTVIPDAPGVFDPDIPPELEEITLRAMQPDPNDRYWAVADMLADLEDFRKGQTAAVGAAVQSALSQRTARDEIHVITRNVPRISKAGELSREGYVRRRARANRISMLLGFSIVLVFALLLFVFVWQYWLRYVFSDAERIDVPTFIGSYAQDIVGDEDMKELFNFHVVYEADATHDEGIITGQDPEPGKSRMIVSEGIDVTLTVSSGIQLVTLPEDIPNSSYTDAKMRLEGLGLNVEIVWEASDTITENYVIGLDPSAGSSVSSGSTVTMRVSAGPAVSYTDVPNLVGLEKSAALLALQQAGLICTESEITYVSSSEEDSGKVIWQNYPSGSQVVSGTQVYLQIGTGPAVTATPAPTPAPTATSAPTEPPAAPPEEEAPPATEPEPEGGEDEPVPEE